MTGIYYSTGLQPDYSVSEAQKNRSAVRLWLYLVAVAVFALVLVGGATRLTDSGLSITEWQPVHGVIPPLSQQAWQEEFDKYRQTPEYRQINAGMTLASFKTIYWWEWLHRFLARAIGLLFALPLAYFWLRGRLERQLKAKLLFILLLGAVQGFIGWWMVASGLVERTDVSQYRLATHLTIACIIFVSLIYVARGLAPHSGATAPTGFKWHAAGLVLLLLVQIYAGGLVAGLDAGLVYNTWPLMDGRIIPQHLATLEPLWRNLFESPKTVQFLHRMIAYLIVLIAAMHAFAVYRGTGVTTHFRRSVVLLLMILVQAMVGIATLLMAVPIAWALAHQAMALAILAFATAHWRGMSGAFPLERPVPYST